jgi:ArsR family metal-binding transcriptional regulator
MKRKKKKIIAESKIKRQVELLKITAHNLRAGLDNAEIKHTLFLTSCVDKLEKIVNEIEDIIKQKDRVKIAPMKIYKYVYSPRRRWYISPSLF